MNLDKVYVVTDNCVWLDISENGIDDGYIVEEDEDYFRVYKNGEYNSYHTYISLYEKELIRESEMALE